MGRSRYCIWDYFFSIDDAGNWVAKSVVLSLEGGGNKKEKRKSPRIMSKVPDASAIAPTRAVADDVQTPVGDGREKSKHGFPTSFPLLLLFSHSNDLLISPDCLAGGGVRTGNEWGENTKHGTPGDWSDWERSSDLLLSVIDCPKDCISPPLPLSPPPPCDIQH